MRRKKNLQIGISDFRHLIEENGYFVDKTLLIKELIDSGFHVLLMPRPRRFGKSLNLSMLKCYFDYREKDTQALFEPFQIWQTDEFYKKQQGRRPVIHFSLKRGKATNFEASKKAIYSVITDIYNDFIWLLETDTLSKNEVADFNKIIFRAADSVLYEAAIKQLSEYLHRQSGEKVLILLDEYDAAIHAGFYHGFYDEIIALMKSILGNTFKDNRSLYKGVITGILRISKESIFSDMNNHGIFTVLSTSFSDKFGFTEKEVKALLEYFNYGEEYPDVKAWYNGYKFGNTEEIYNPWSICNYIALHADGFKSYWGNTSSDDIIRSSITTRENTEIRADIEALIKGESITKILNANITFSDLRQDPDIFWSLLTFSGYLTPVQDFDFDTYELRIPNYEIHTLFRKIILTWFSRDLKVYQNTLRKMTTALAAGRFIEFEAAFKKIMGDTFSYFDIHTEPERVFQAYVLGLLGMLSDDYIIKSNRELGKGRYDILLIPKDRTRYGILMELKQIDKDATDDKVQASLASALQQIQDNQYYKELKAQAISEHLEIAIVFVGKEAYLRHQFRKIN
ncbi:MAG: AAA family ATPase [Bacteroidota bacterium]